LFFFPFLGNGDGVLAGDVAAVDEWRVSTERLVASKGNDTGEWVGGNPGRSLRDDEAGSRTTGDERGVDTGVEGGQTSTVLRGESKEVAAGELIRGGEASAPEAAFITLDQADREMRRACALGQLVEHQPR
jgi:hypothetical protein